MDHHAHTESHAGGSADQAPPAGHGMLVVGQDSVFFYHLPMFMSPHDYQVILEGTLSQSGSDPQRIYREDRKGHPQTRVYTFAPVPFVLPDLFPPAPKLKKIKGDLFRGHFESPPEYPADPFEIGTGVDVTIVNVVFVKKLLPVSSPPNHLEYVLFGKGRELFLAHRISRKGDFDQVVSAAIKGHQFSDDELRKGIPVQFTGKADASEQRLAKGATVSGTARVSDKSVAVEVEPQVEFYMSERDLR
jgi:hypothetical protein